MTMSSWLLWLPSILWTLRCERSMSLSTLLASGRLSRKVCGVGTGLSR